MEQIKTIQVGENTYTIGAEQEAKTDITPVLKRETLKSFTYTEGSGSSSSTYTVEAGILRPNIQYENTMPDSLINISFIPLEYYGLSGTVMMTMCGFGIFYDQDTEIEGYPYKLLMTNYSMGELTEFFFSYNPTIEEYTDDCSIKMRSRHYNDFFPLEDFTPPSSMPSPVSPQTFKLGYDKMLFDSYDGAVITVRIEDSGIEEYPYAVYWANPETGNDELYYYLTSLELGGLASSDGMTNDRYWTLGVLDAYQEIETPNIVNSYHLYLAQQNSNGNLDVFGYAPEMARTEFSYNKGSNDLYQVEIEIKNNMMKMVGWF